MKKIKNMLAIVLAMALFFSLAACGGSSSSSTAAAASTPESTSVATGGGGEVNEDAIVIRVGGTVNESHPVTLGLFKLEELFEAATDGAYDMQVHTNMTLGSPAEMFEAVQLGNLEMMDSGSMVLYSFNKGLSYMDIPFLFASREIALEYVDTDIAKKGYDVIAEECNIRPLVAFDLGYMTLSNNVREINTPEDLKGVKFRVQDTDMYLKYFELLGGSPIPMAFNETFTAIQQGTIDGTTTQNAVFYTNRYYEITEYLSDMNPFYNVDFLYVCESWLQALPEDVRETFIDCAQQAAEYQRDYAKTYMEEIDAELEELVTVTHLTDEARAQFVETAEPMIDYHKETVGDPLLDDYLAEVEKIAASHS